MILLTSRRSPVYHLPHPREWNLALCGTRVRIETTLEDLQAEFAGSTLRVQECAKCRRLATKTSPVRNLTDSRSHG